MGPAIEGYDAGPGIVDVELALHDGFSTVVDLAVVHLPSVAMMDDFTIVRAPQERPLRHASG